MFVRFRMRLFSGTDFLNIKLIFDRRSGRIYGVQIAGRTGVDKRIDVFSTAMRAGLTADKLAELELAYAPPFGAARDAVNLTGSQQPMCFRTKPSDPLA